jgi:ketosteroid isomerase-like protein
MSQKNVEVVRRGTEAWNRGDIHGFLEAVHPNIEAVPVIAELAEGTETVYKGISGARRFWEDWRVEWDFQFGETEFRDLGNTVLALTRISLTGLASGLDLDAPMAVIYRFEDGRVVRIHSYLDIDEALEAAGLSE